MATAYGRVEDRAYDESRGCRPTFGGDGRAVPPARVIAMRTVLALAVLSPLVLTVTTVTPARASRLALPEPTGREPVGLATLHLVDRSRPDPWNPEADRRELMVSLWYPAEKAAGEPAPYVPRQVSQAVLADYPVADKDALTKVRTHARLNAPAAKGRRPLVVMSPGFSFPRATLTSLAEDFASRGYLVAAVEHTYESVATTFPGGRTTPCLACVDGQDAAKVVAGRVKDVRFVLDELSEGRWGRRIDRSKIAMVGHSIGGYLEEGLAPADRLEALDHGEGHRPLVIRRLRRAADAAGPPGAAARR